MLKLIELNQQQTKNTQLMILQEIVTRETCAQQAR